MALGHCASGLLFLCTFLLCWGLHYGCYTCIASTQELQGLCRYLQHASKMEDPEKCKEALNRGFQPLDNGTIPYAQLSKIKRYLQTFDKEVRRIDVLLDFQSWHDLFKRKMAEYVIGVLDIASRHQLADCVPPCGLQKEARTYSCRRCVEEDCDIPVACELEDIHVQEDGRTEMSCNVTFTLPDSYTVLWKFARKFRQTNLSFFKFKQQLDNVIDFVISPTQPRHRGTYLCEIQDYDGDTLVEKFFFVNVSRKDRYQSRYLKWLFKQITGQTGTNRSVLGWKTKKDEDSYGFEIPGFFFSKKPLSTKALIFVTITIFMFVFFLAILPHIAYVYYNDNGDYTPRRRRRRRRSTKKTQQRCIWRLMLLLSSL